MFDSLQLHGLQHTRLPCPSLSAGVCSNSCPLSQLCYPTISSSATSFSFGLQSFPASGTFLMSQLVLHLINIGLFFFFDIFLLLSYLKYRGGFPGGSEVKASACNAGVLGSIPGSVFFLSSMNIMTELNIFLTMIFQRTLNYYPFYDGSQRMIPKEIILSYHFQ